MKNFYGKSKVVLSILMIIVCFSCKKENQPIDKAGELNTKTGEVSLSLAKNVAENFFLKKQTGSGATMSTKSSSNGSLNREVMNSKTVQAKNGKDLYHIINFVPSGFAIISATMKHEPILAYSENGYFDYDKVDYGTKDWADGMANDINYRIVNDVTPDSSVVAQWKVLGTQSAPPIDEEIIISGGSVFESKGPFLLTTWDQGDGYNDGIYSSYGCSSTTNGKPPIGCVATATGQVMKYWSFPTYFLWSDMPNAGGYGSVPTLLYNIADHVDMSFNCDGSGSNLKKAKNALKDYYGYSSSTNYGDFNENTVVQELNANRPVILGGINPNTGSGHAWVADGYQRTVYIYIHNPGTQYEYTTGEPTNYLLHINWGWSGAYNGYYLSYGMNPGSSNYNSDRDMVYGIKP